MITDVTVFPHISSRAYTRIISRIAINTHCPILALVGQTSIIRCVRNENKNVSTLCFNIPNKLQTIITSNMITDVTVFPRISSRAYRIGIKHCNEHTYTLVSGLKCNSIEVIEL